MTDRTALHHLLCQQWCADATIVEDNGALRISLPLVEGDGDVVTVWLESVLGGWRIRDKGTTFLRLSYDVDLDLVNEGQRARVVERILSEHGVASEAGELTMTTEEAHLARALMAFGQAVLRVSDVRLWTRHRIASTFYEDLQRELERIAGQARVHPKYVVPEIPDALRYEIDFKIDTPAHNLPFYVFGVPTLDKARLTTITLLHLLSSGHRFDSLVVAADLEDLQKDDRKRLINAANDLVTDFAETSVLERKVRMRIDTKAA